MIRYPTDNRFRAAALSYAKGRLEQGKTFASLLLETIDFQRGDLSAQVPDGYSPQQTVEFERAHLVREGIPRRITVGNLSGIAFPVPTADKDLTMSVCKMLETPESYGLLENSLAIPQDAWLKTAKSRIVTYESDVYHLLTHDERNEASVEQAIREAYHFPTFIGAVGRAEEISRRYSSMRMVVTLDELRMFAQSVKLLFVSAYDGEGYLCWRG